MEPARSLLAPVARLERWLDVALVALLVACAVRYVLRHGLHAQGWLVIAGATVLALVALLRPRAGDGPVSVLRVVVLVLVWSALTLMAPSFAWAAVAVAFAVLRALPFLYAACVVALMALVVSVGSLRISDGFDPTLVVGPIAMAILTVAAFRALDREAADRQALLDDLRTAQDDLVVAERRAGGFAERARISREIHDSVGQGLSSINLLLQAAEQDWDRQPENAPTHVGRAAQTPRAGLDEVRRVVRDLAPSELDGDTVEGLHEALGEIVREGVRVVGAGGRTLNEAHDLDLDLDLGACCDLDPDPARDVDPGRDLGPGPGSDRAAGLHGELRVHGTPTPLPREVGAAILRTTRGALANVVEHAGASRVAVTLTYQRDEVRLDIRDDGCGFDASQPRRRGDRGTGLDGIRDRAAHLGGRVDVETAPGEGTTVSVALPKVAPGTAPVTGAAPAPQQPHPQQPRSHPPHPQPPRPQPREDSP